MRTLLSHFSIGANPSSRVDTQARAIFVRLHTAPAREIFD